MTPHELLESANLMPFMAWKARAKEALGAGAPDTKVELIKALEATLPRDAVPPEIKAPEGAVEVNLTKKYTPFKIMNEDGVFVEQDKAQPMQSISPGPAYLEKKEAQRVLERKQATPTHNTFAQMGA